MSRSDVEEQVLPQALNKRSLSPEEQKILLDQYKLYVEMTDRISQRRQTANSYFLLLCTGLATSFSFFASYGTSTPVWAVLICFSGMVVSYTWHRSIRSYKDINRGKFLIIHQIEQCLPARPYVAEWDVLGKGVDRKLYLPFTHIEQKVPWVFGFLYTALACFLLVTNVRLLFPKL
jgi:hypothetical protein